jgi:hypothetical protein
MSTTIRRGATAAMVGGALWALLPAAFSIHPEPGKPGTLVFVAGVLVTWLFAVIAPALLLFGVRGATAALPSGPWRTAAAAVCTAGLAGIVAGMGTEAFALTAAGVENDVGHVVFLISVCVLVIGELLLGITVLRGRRDGPARAAAVPFVLALPLGVGLAVLLNAVAPGTDAGFWVAFTVPTGIGWLLLGRAVLPRTRAERTALV